MHGFQNPNIIDHPIEDDGRFPSSRNRRHSGFAPSPSVSAMRRVSTIAWEYLVVFGLVMIAVLA